MKVSLREEPDEITVILSEANVRWLYAKLGWKGEQPPLIVQITDGLRINIGVAKEGEE